MMQFLKRVLTKKKGVTILEGLIALGLLALVAAGTFGVLLSVARKSGAPDIREEMVLAVERANDQLQMYSSGIVSGMTNSKLYEQYANGMCGGSLIPAGVKVSDSSPMSIGSHNIKCMLPPLCDYSNSTFTYTVREASFTTHNYGGSNMVTDYASAFPTKGRQVTFNITCNGFTL
ncbi:hypothetical protein [Candidatus Avelusimicrobium fimicolum]|jgi:hypothetical protein|uniref:hypothetical protein n=1 Tax=Candidatus Avelusimicrobium fimicolum TaxID=3416216 RepID=UPI003D0A65E6